ncbi:hypothetical protein FLM55_03675 [Francisella sp. Scap27]|uniref:transcriptional regulator FevR n=1 Tax=Francisella sp. Scap27 TaxID=2589986 RepID=UPI0015BE8FAC|nr:hypothetical protein [Francisella sp. Scap27]QLE78885.1 hypothetical protein FLM55_03675 [Francisella sp. Scap27]
MANQYTGNFEQIMTRKFNCSAKEALLICQSKGLSYEDAEEFLGFKHVTIRKWAKRLDVKLSPTSKTYKSENISNKGTEYIRNCKSKTLSAKNLLSRCWINMSLYSTIKAKS